jgi:hypothetical protein
MKFKCVSLIVLSLSLLSGPVISMEKEDDVYTKIIKKQLNLLETWYTTQAGKGEDYAILQMEIIRQIKQTFCKGAHEISKKGAEEEK